MKRRQILFELALVLGGTPALPILRHITPDDESLLAGAVRGSTRIDVGVVTALEKLTASCWRNDELFGPNASLPVAEAQRKLTADFLHRQSLAPKLRNRLMTIYWELSHLTGWAHYDLRQYTTADQRYRDGLEIAHEMGEPMYIAHTHNLLASMALYRSQPTKALDHAFAARGWAQSSSNPLQRAATSLMLARVLAKTRRDPASLNLLDTGYHLAQQHSVKASGHLYWVTPSGVKGNRVFCLLALGQSGSAIHATEQALKGVSIRRKGEVLAESVEALIQKREIPAAAERLGELAEISVIHSSRRLRHSLTTLRKQLDPWNANSHIRHLDERLHSAGLADKKPALRRGRDVDPPIVS